MNVYLIIGTHFGEIRQCLHNLVRSDKEGGSFEAHLPDGLDWEATGEDGYSIKPYQADSVNWVLDPDSDDTAFIVIDPRQPLIEQLEKLADDLAKCLIEPVKIVTFVDCQKTGNSPQLKAWLEASIYYSDIVLLGNRQEASKTFIREYQKHYERLCYPCLFMFLKGNGIPADPVEILTPGTRRISQLFDIKQDTPEEPLPGMVIEASCDLDMEEEEADPFRRPGPDEEVAHVPDVTECVVPAEA